MKKILALVLCLSMTGCLIPPEMFKPSVNVEVTELTQAGKDMGAAIDAASYEDCLVLYKLFGGLALYIKESKNEQDVGQVVNLIKKCQVDLGYESGKFPQINTVTVKYIESLGLNENINLDSVAREKISNLFHEFALGVKSKAESKSNGKPN